MIPSRNDPQNVPKVLHCIPNLGLGGAVTVAFDLVRFLRDEFRFEIVAVRGVTDGAFGAALLEEAKTLGVTVHIGSNIPMRFGGVLTSGFELASVLRRSRPDLIHLHTEIPEAAQAAASMISARARQLPAVRTIHNAVYWEFSPRLGRWCDRRLAGASVVGVSRFAIAAFLKLRRSSGAPNPPETPRLVYNGVKAPQAKAISSSSDDAPFKIVFGGRLADEKGADLLPAIFGRVRPPDSRKGQLEIFGSGNHELALKRFAAKPPTGWEVNVHAPIANFAAQLGEFDLAVVPSRNEGLALVAIEAILAGIPVVATSAFGLKDVFSPDYPWLAEPGNPESFAIVLQDAIDRAAEWTPVVARAREFALQRFSPTTMAESYRNLYNRQIRRSPSPSGEYMR